MLEATQIAGNEDYGAWNMQRVGETLQHKISPERAPSIVTSHGFRVALSPHGEAGPLTEKQAKLVAEKLLSLDDESAVAGMAAIATWIRAHGETITYTADPERLPILPPVRVVLRDIVALQGRAKQIAGGYKTDQKRDIAAHLENCADMRIMGEDEIWEKGPRGTQRRAIQVDGPFLHLEAEYETTLAGERAPHPYAYRVIPGSWIVPCLDGWRRIAHVFTALMQYDPSRPGMSRVAHRIGLYFAFQWRIGSANRTGDQSLRVSTILEGAHIPVPTHRQQQARLRQQVEYALDALAGWGFIEGDTLAPAPLQHRTVIKAWAYVGDDPSTIAQWLGTKVETTQPEAAAELAERVAQQRDRRRAAIDAARKGNSAKRRKQAGA